MIGDKRPDQYEIEIPVQMIYGIIKDIFLENNNFIV
jgi:predicted DNA-binding protein (UPF0278 family)